MIPVPWLPELLDLLAVAARRGQPLPEALRASALPGADALADRLAEGATLADALAGVVPEDLRGLMGGGDLERAALLAGDALRLRQRRRSELFAAVCYPALCLFAIGGAAIGFALAAPGPPAWAWLGWGVPGIVVLVAAAVVPWLPERGLRIIPVIGSTQRHARLAQRWERVALAAGLCLDEAAAQRWFAVDLRAVAHALARPDAQAHAGRLARWHAAAAARSAIWRDRLLAAALLSIAGSVVVACALGAFSAYLRILRAA